MSSRQLRKLQQQKALAQTPPQESEESEEIEEPVVSKSRPRPNLFAALGGEDEDDEGAGQDDEDDEGTEAAPAHDVTETHNQAASKKSKKKKKKKKAKAAAALQEESPRDGDEDEDEIDRAIKELKINPGSQDASSITTSENRSSLKANELLKVNTYHLKAVNEMRNLFGREVIESANAEEQQEYARRRREAGQQDVDLETFLREPPGAKKLPEVSLRRNVFVQGRDHWPRQSAGGLTMKEIQKAADWTEYAYIHEKDYDGIQAFFFSCVQIGDPMRMVHLLKRVRTYIWIL